MNHDINERQPLGVSAVPANFLQNLYVEQFNLFPPIGELNSEQVRNNYYENFSNIPIDDYVRAIVERYRIRRQSRRRTPVRPLGSGRPQMSQSELNEIIEIFDDYDRRHPENNQQNNNNQNNINNNGDIDTSNDIDTRNPETRNNNTELNNTYFNNTQTNNTKFFNYTKIKNIIWNFYKKQIKNRFGRYYYHDDLEFEYREFLKQLNKLNYSLFDIEKLLGKKRERDQDF
jgi:hypothetical protein